MLLEEVEDGASDIERVVALALADGFGAAPNANLERMQDSSVAQAQPPRWAGGAPHPILPACCLTFSPRG